MQFTAQEMKLIDRLRKEDRRWPRTRWILLVVAAFALAVYGYIGAQIVIKLESAQPGDDSMFMVAFFWPKCLLGFCFAAWFIAWAIRDWHGNVQRMLLLRLLDDKLKERGKDENVG